MGDLEKVFYGAAIQGGRVSGERAHINRELIDVIKSEGYHVLSEHTAGSTKDEMYGILNRTIGPLPLSETERNIYLRRKMIEFVESDIKAAVFEFSVSSSGTGVEFTHAYSRPRFGLKTVPILALYQNGYWQNGLSTMIEGISREELPHVKIIVYKNLDDAKSCLVDFLGGIKK